MLALHLFVLTRLVLKILHSNKGILTTTECGKCASEKWNWWKLTAIVLATKPPDVVQQTLDVVRETNVECDFYLKKLTSFLKGEVDITAIDT